MPSPGSFISLTFAPWVLMLFHNRSNSPMSISTFPMPFRLTFHEGLCKGIFDADIGLRRNGFVRLPWLDIG